jgi:alkanesulfonate monooxygenase SsuD/methylene tetrahydromethanopterin reductase-like flavin-dependent oxidoreductase (luciferase family)
LTRASEREINPLQTSGFLPERIGVAMQFSIYSELQTWPGKTQKQVYDEALEQLVNADRLAYDAYAIIEHFFFPKFGASPNPFAFFAKASERTKNIKFRTLVHVLPYHNPTILASQIAAFDLLVDERYEFGLGRGHAWLALKAGVLVEETRDRYEESFRIVLDALANERFSHDGTYYKVEDSHIVPRPTAGRKFRIFLGGTSDSTYELAGERGFAMVVPPLLPYEALREQLDIYRASCAKHGNEPDIVWIHAVHLDEDRETAKREAEQMMRGFLKGNASVLLENADEMASKERLEASGYGFYASGIMEQLSDMPYDEMIEKDVVWVGTPQDVIERIEGVQELCEGLTEIAITVNPGGVEHWKSIKTQELFAAHVMPHFQAAAREKEAEPALA